MQPNWHHGTVENPINIWQNSWHYIVNSWGGVSTAPTGNDVSLESLEDRVLYDASPLLSLLATAEPVELSDSIDQQFVDLMSHVDVALSNQSFSDLSNHLNKPVFLLEDEGSMASFGVPTIDQVDLTGLAEAVTLRQLVVIDDSVEGYQQLFDDLANNAAPNVEFEIVRLNSATNGMEQITELLNGNQHYRAVHIVSHGSAGQVPLGNSVLTSQNVIDYQQQLSAWSDGLTGDADILMYGCDVSANESGQRLLEQIVQYIGADIVASQDFTGHDSLGGKLHLEFPTDHLDPAVVFSSQISTQQNLLVEDAVTDTVDDGSVGSFLATGLTTGASEADIGTGTNAGDATPMRNEIVFVDANVANYQAILDQFHGIVEVILLNPETDGLTQISEVLAGRSGLDTIRIFSHGLDGAFQVGATWIDQFTLNWQADIIASWGTALTENADLLLYGCSIASTSDGQAFINQLAELTGADVTASTDTTGNAALGGNWELEYSTGSIESDEAIDADDMHDWMEVLAITANGTATSAQTTLGSSLTWSHTVGNGPNRALFVTLDLDAVGSTVTSLTYGGVALTQVGRTTGNHAVEIWRLLNPTVGTANVVVNVSAASTINGGAVTYNGVDQTTPTDTYASASGTGTSASVVVTSATNDVVLDITNWDSDPAGYTIGAGQTQNYTETNATHRGVSTTEAGAASVTMSSTVSTASQWEIGAVSVKAASNNAPVLVNTALSLAIAEDLGAPAGAVGSLVSVFTSGITDADSGAVDGIAITATDETNGTWYYTTNSGTTWNTVGTVSTAVSLLLADDPNTRLYFSPGSNYNGLSTSALTFRAWDQTSGTAGSTASTSSAGGTTAFSSATDVIDVTVSAVNDAPLLTAYAPVYNFAEGASTFTTTVATVLSTYVSDVDAGAINGIAVFGLSGNGGTLEYTINGGSSWTSIGAVSSTSALLLRSTDSIRFTPDSDNGGALSLSYRAWDQTTGTAGTNVNASVTGGTTAFSTVSDVMAINTTSVNDAPVLDNTGNMTLTTITEDQTANSGSTIASVISSAGGDRITDVDNVALEGVAITSLSSGNGTWEYSTNGGSTWTSMGAVSNTSALLLRDSDWVRFVPNAQNATTADFTFRAWDQSTGTFGSKVDVSTNGSTTAYSSATEVAAITVTAVNDAPTLNNTKNPALLAQSEYAGTPAGAAGTLISYFVDYSSPSGQVDNAVDVDLGSVLGIAITASDSTNGTWYYTINDGVNWLLLGTISDSSARLLAADADTRLYFEPSPGFNGPINNAITFRVWDTTSGINGGLADTTANGGTTAFSAVTDSASMQVNDAPVLDNTGDMILTTITEDDTTNTGQTIASVIASAGGDRITDANTGAVEGIAITSLNSGNGTWQYSINGGSSWLAVGTVSSSSALLLQDSDLIRFIPDAQNATAADFSFRAWDQSSGTAGSKVDVTANETTTPFSTATEVAAITVTAVNDAPVLDNLKSPVLTTESEFSGVASGAVGTLVSGLVDFSSPVGQVDNLLDVDTGALLGIAVTGVNSTNGTWYYSTNNGASWSAIGAVADNNARLLATDANTRLYFNPNASYNGLTSNAITFRAWDQTTGANGGLADTTTNGTTTAFSTATDTASLVVNDAPVLDNSGNTTLTTITEDQTTNGGHTVATIIASAGGDRITDTNTGAVEGIAITTLTSGNGTWQYSTNGGSTWTAIGTVSSSSALLLRSTDLVRFVPNAQNATTGDFTFRAWDQSTGTFGAKVDLAANGTVSSFSTASEIAAITATAVNDAPVLDNTGNTVLTTITEDQTTNGGNTVASIILSAGGDRITDVDNGAVEGIAISAVSSGNGTWQYSTNGGSTWTAIGTVTNTSALLLRSTDLVRFVPNGLNATSGDITFRAWDQSTDLFGTKVDVSINGTTTAFSTATEIASITVSAVNDAPVLDNGGNPAFSTITEDETTNGGQSVVAIISSAGGDRITDVDSGAVEGMAITALTSGNGTWQYSLNAGGTWTTIGTVSNTSALLLRNIDFLRFVPNAQNATTGDITFRGWDQSSGTAGTKVTTATNGGTSAFSTATEVASITVTAVNDAPTLTTGSLAAVNEDTVSPPGQSVSTIFGGKFADVDSGASFGGIAVVGNTANAGTQGTWQYSTDGSNWYAVGSVAEGPTALALSASTLIRFVPVADYYGSPSALLVRGIDDFYGGGYSTAAGSETRISVNTTTNGGTTAIAAATANLTTTISAVNDAPVITTSLTPIAYTENGSPLLVANAFSVADVDSPDLNTGTLTVSFSAGGTANDRLTLVPGGPVTVLGNSINFSGIAVATFTGGTNGSPLVITFNANTTPGIAQVIGQQIGYYNVSDAPLTTSRTLDFILTDGDGGTSATVQKSLSVAASADVPIAVDDGSRLVFDGIDDYVNIGNNPSLEITGGTLTMEAWINPTSYNVGSGSMVLNREGEYEIGISDTGTLRWAIGNTNPGWVWHDTGYVVPLDQWSHLAVSYNNGVVSSYVNGTLVDRYFGSGNITDANVAKDDFRIGGREDNPVGQYFYGQIDDVRIWNVARSETQIRSNLDQVLAPQAGLIGYWQLNEGSGSTTADSAGSNTGTLVDGGGGTVGPQWNNYSTNQNSTLNVNVVSNGILANDRDGDSIPLTVSQVNGSGASVGTQITLASGAKLTVNAAGTFLYDPNSAFNILAAGQTTIDSFDYQVSDGTGNFDTATAFITVIGSNDAPGLGNGTLGPIVEDTTDPAGDTVSTIFAGQFSDIDASGSFGGIAIVGNSANPGTQGQWQYSTDGGSSWFSIGSVSDGATALALGTSTRLRFVPVADYSGTPTPLVTRGLDNTYGGSFSSGASRVNIDTTTNGGSSSISGGTANVNTSVTPINDAPVLDNNGSLTLTTITEDDFSNSGNTVAQIIASDGGDWITDADSGAVEGIAITTVSNGNGKWQYNTGSGWTDVGTVSTTNALLLRAIDSLRFVPDGKNSDFISVFFHAWDQTAGTAGTKMDSTSTGGTLSISDGTQYAYLTVTDVNDAPTDIAPNSSNIAENTDTSGSLSVATLTSADVDSGDTYTYTVVGGADQAKFSIAGDQLMINDGVLDFENQSSYSVTVRTTDSGGLWYEETLTINVNDLNETPTDIAPNSFSINENTDTTASVSVGTLTSTDVDSGDTLTYTVVGGADQAKFSISGDQLVITDGLLNFENQSSYAVTVRSTDSGGLWYEEALTIDVNDLNETPSDIAPNSFSIDENTDTTAGVSVGTLTSTDVDSGETFAYTVVGGSDQAKFSINGDQLVLTDGILNFENQAGYTVMVRTTDAGGLTYDEELTILVNDLNEAPVILNQTFAINENSANGTTVGTVAASDVDGGDTLAYSIIGGSGAMTFSVDPMTGELQVSDATQLDFETTPTFGLTIEVRDSNGLTDTANLTINLNDVNDEQMLVTNLSLNVAEGGTGVIDGSLLLTTDPDHGPSVLIYTITSAPTNGVVLNNGIVSTTFTQGELNLGVVTYVHDGSESTIDSFGFSVDDPIGTSTSGTFMIGIAPINDAPEANDDWKSLLEGYTYNGSVGELQANDFDAEGSVLWTTLVTGPTHGTLVLNANGSFSYVHDGSETVSDSFQYLISDGDLNSNVATVNLNIIPVNDAPIGFSDHFTMNAGFTLTQLLGTVLNDTDAESNPINAILVELPTHGTVVLNANGSFIYTPDSGFYGADVFRYIPTDGMDAGNLTTVTISVIAVSQPIEQPANEPRPTVTNSELDHHPNSAAANVGTGAATIEESTFKNTLSNQEMSSKTTIDLSNVSANDQESFDIMNRMIDVRQAEAILRSILDNTVIELSDDPEQLRRIRAGSTIGVAFNASYLWEKMEGFGDNSRFDIDEVRVNLGAITALGTIGYLWWSLRGGVLVAAALANSPTWRMLDMLPVLDSYASENGNRKLDEVDELFE